MTIEIDVEQILENAPDAVPMPETATKIIKKSSDPATTMVEMADILATDQALAARVLTIANSAFYGLRRQVATINEAAILLGIRTIRNLALTASMSGLAKQSVSGYGLPRGELFKHSLAMANVSKHVSTETNKSIPDEAYTAGLLHDIGKLVLSDYVGQELEAIRQKASEENVSFAKAERLTLGIDHAEVAAAMAEKWELPDFLTSAIKSHHGLDNGATVEATSLSAVCILSNQMTRTIGSGRGANETDDPPVNPAILEILGIQADNLVELAAEIKKNVDAASEMADGAES